MLPVQNAAVSPFSRHKEAAWYFVQWLTNKQNFVRRQLQGNSSARISTWSDPGFLDTPAAKANPDWIDVTLGAIKYGRNWVSPPILAVDEFRDVLAKAVDAVVLGTAPPEQALKEVQAEADALLERTEPKDRKLEDWSKLKIA
jgi:multiple sugar transport system substrate-binding protein